MMGHPTLHPERLDALAQLVSAAIAIRAAQKLAHDTAPHPAHLAARLKTALFMVTSAIESISPQHVTELTAIEFGADPIGDVCAAIRRIEAREGAR